MITRREFVKSSAAAAAGTLVAAPFAPRACAASLISHADTLKVGLVGCGGRGTGAALQAIKADPHAILYSMGDAFADRIDSSLGQLSESIIEEEAGPDGNPPLTPENPSLNERVQVAPERRHTGFDAYQKVIDECDVVLLTSPPHFRPMQLRAAVEAGRHVFCEKPMAVDGPGVRSLLETARRAKEKHLAIVSGFCWRYSAKERDTFRKLHEGAIGDIRAIYTTYNAGGWVGHKPRSPQWTDMEYQVRNWHYFTWLSGDHIVEQAIHAIDRMAWAMQDVMPIRCTAVGGRQVRDAIGEPGNAYDHFSVTYEFANGARGFHMCRHFPNTPFDNADYILGARGTCTINSWGGVHKIVGENAWQCETPRNDMYQQEHDDLFASIRTGTPINDGEWMATSTMLAIMGRMAAYTGQVITWEQALNSQEELKPLSYEWHEAPPQVEIARPGLTKFT